MKKNCPTLAQWSLYLADTSITQAEHELDDHLEACQHCQRQLEELTSPATITQAVEYLQTQSSRAALAARLEDDFIVTMQANDEELEHSLDTLPTIPGYDILETIGQGGSSIVYRARDLKLSRIVAIKWLREKSTPVQKQRFQQEARLLASLHHANVAGIISVGEAAGADYLVLEYIAGGSLARYLAGQPQPPPTSARLIQQLAQALQKAHDAGFIHRDLKPGNILLDPHFGASETSGLDRYLPKIIDFGIAKVLKTTEDFTHTGDFLGTPSYMAPEQITHSDQPVDPRTDVYALGTVLYELLTGRPPFRTASPIDTMLQIRYEEPVSPRRFEPKLPADLETICLKCLEKDPARRYTSAQQLADDLACFLAGQPVHARPVSRITRAWRWSLRNPGWASSAALVLLMLSTAAILGSYWAHREHQLREAAALERNRAREHLSVASKALEEMLDRFLSNMRIQDAAFDDLQKGLVSFAIPYLEQFAEQDDTEDTVRLRQARSQLQLASVLIKNKDIEKAQKAYEHSITTLQAMQPSATLPVDMLKRSQASAQMEYGRFLHVHRKDAPAAERHYRRSLELMDTSDTISQDSLAIIYSLLGSALGDQPGHADESLHFSLLAAQVRNRLLEQHPTRDDLRHYAAMAHMNLAINYRTTRQRTLEVEQFQKALDLEKQVNLSKAIWMDSPYFVSVLQGELAMSLYDLNRKDEAFPLLRQAQIKANALATTYPGIEKYQLLAQRWAYTISKLK